MRQVPFLAALCGLSVLLTGCGGGSDNSVAPIADAPVTTRSQYEPLVLTLSLPKSLYKRGETVSATFTVTNTSTNNVTTVTGPGADYLRVMQGNEVIYLSTNAGAAVLMPATFMAGETKTYSQIWKQTSDKGTVVGAGAYTLYAQYDTLSISEEAKETITVPSSKFGFALDSAPAEIKIQQ